jgi:regulatory protein
MSKATKIYTATQALQKMQRLCVFQERSQDEIRRKLYETGFKGIEAEQIIVRLIEDGFINEERFAKSYISGKFKIKSWGRIKIKAGLLQHGLPSKLIDKLLKSEISEDDYHNSLLQLLRKLHPEGAVADDVMRYQLIRKLYAKGYEPVVTEKVFSEKFIKSDD